MRAIMLGRDTPEVSQSFWYHDRIRKQVLVKYCLGTYEDRRLWFLWFKFVCVWKSHRKICWRIHSWERFIDIWLVLALYYPKKPSLWLLHKACFDCSYRLIRLSNQFFHAQSDWFVWLHVELIGEWVAVSSRPKLIQNVIWIILAPMTESNIRHPQYQSITMSLGLAQLAFF